VTDLLKAFTALARGYPRLRELYGQTHVILIEFGDFMEAFDGDAETVAGVCGVLLQRRRFGGEERPVAGFPAFAAEQHIARLLEAGHRVALVQYAGSQDDG
jgi:DNA mismatch repair protein MutS